VRIACSIAAMLDRIADDVWTTERSQRFWGIETGTRMTVVRLGGGGLFIHCPVALDEPTRSSRSISTRPPRAPRD
jgi:hypothetical protein